MASSKLGSQIIQKPRDILRRDLPNLILSRSDSRWASLIFFFPFVLTTNKELCTNHIFLILSHDGWISPRNNSRSYRSEYTVIKLAQEGTIDRIVLDTKHFIGNAPKFVIVEGCSLVDQVYTDKVGWGFPLLRLISILDFFRQQINIHLDMFTGSTYLINQVNKVKISIPICLMYLLALIKGP